MAITNNNSNDNLTIIDNRTRREYIIPINNGSIPAIEFSKIRPSIENKGDIAEGLRVFDSGYQNTAVVRSKICFIDGEKGVLEYRGYPIEELAEKSTFIEVAYLLIYGELPTKVRFQSIIHKYFLTIYRSNWMNGMTR